MSNQGIRMYGTDGLVSRAIRTNKDGYLGIQPNNNKVLKASFEVGAGRRAWPNGFGGDFPETLPLDISDYNSFSITVTADSEHQFELDNFSWRDSSDQTFPSSIGNFSSKGEKTIQTPFFDIKAHGLRFGVVNRSEETHNYTINLILKSEKSEPIGSFGNTVAKFINSDFAYANPGRRFFGKNGPVPYASVEVLDMSLYGNRTILINNRHTDISISVEIMLATSPNGLLIDNELGTLITDTISPGQNKLYYPHSHPELDIPAPGLAIGIQRQGTPTEPGLGVDVFVLGGLV